MCQKINIVFMKLEEEMEAGGSGDGCSGNVDGWVEVEMLLI